MGSPFLPYLLYEIVLFLFLNVIKLLVKSVFYSLNVWTEVLSEFLICLSRPLRSEVSGSSPARTQGSSSMVVQSGTFRRKKKETYVEIE